MMLKDPSSTFHHLETLDLPDLQWASNVQLLAPTVGSVGMHGVVFAVDRAGNECRQPRIPPGPTGYGKCRGAC